MSIIIVMQSKMYFDANSKFLREDISALLLKNFRTRLPIIICLGSNKILSDMVGTFVADILRERKIKTFIFGGINSPTNRILAKKLSLIYKNEQILYVDSGLICKENSIVFFNNEVNFLGNTKLSGAGIVAGTIAEKNGEIKLASQSFLDIYNLALKIADAICDYFSYVQLISLKNCI